MQYYLIEGEPRAEVITADEDVKLTVGPLDYIAGQHSQYVRTC
jgi:hypothetical protein